MSAICDTHMKKVGVELLDNSVHRIFNQLETRYGRESQHPAEGALRPPINQLVIRRVGDKMRLRKPAPREAGLQVPGLVAQENRKETLMAMRVGVNMLQFCSGRQLPLTHNLYFSKNCVACLYCVVMILHADVYVYVLCGYITNRQSLSILVFIIAYNCEFRTLLQSSGVLNV